MCVGNAIGLYSYNIYSRPNHPRQKYLLSAKD